jgi:hypothetical protein
VEGIVWHSTRLWKVEAKLKELSSNSGRTNVGQDLERRKKTVFGYCSSIVRISGVILLFMAL